MLIVEMNDPGFVAIRSFEISTEKGTIVIGESEPCSFVSDPDGNAFIGNGGTVLHVQHNTALLDIFNMISPATFKLIAEDSGEMSLCATLVEPRQVVPSRIERRFNDVAKIISIRPFEGVES
jgi:methyl coenzyme M reductase subunit C-like uncharacterized protein (methanogenesis marker protein 7)